jgi:hypothetical protein
MKGLGTACISSPTADYTFRVGGSRIGFVDRDCEGYGRTWCATYAELGSLGSHEMPVSAATCWGIVVLLLIVIVTLPAMFAGCRLKSVRSASATSPTEPPLQI